MEDSVTLYNKNYLGGAIDVPLTSLFDLESIKTYKYLPHLT